jgi:hypothetical protein
MQQAFIWNATVGSMQPDYNNNTYSPSYDFDKFGADATLYRQAAKSATYCLNATYFNNTGMVTGAQFNPNILFAGTLASFFSKLPLHFYTFIKQAEHRRRRAGGVIVDRRHPDLALHANNFALFPTYVQAEMRRVLGLKDDEFPMIDPNTTIQVANFGRSSNVPAGDHSIVPTPSQLMNLTTRSYTGKAMDGAFIVSRQNTVSPAWCTAGNTHGAGTGDHNLYQCWSYVVDSADAEHFVPMAQNEEAGTTPTTIGILHDTLWSSDQTWGWVYFQGLSLNSQTNTSTQLIMRKIYDVLEIQPAMISPWSGMTRPAPQPNMRAMLAIMDGFYGLKDCLPAAYNFWGALLSAVAPSLLEAGKQGVQSLVKHLTRSEDTGRTEPAESGQPRPTAARPRRTARAVRQVAPGRLVEYKPQTNVRARAQSLAPALANMRLSTPQITKRNHVREGRSKQAVVLAKPKQHRAKGGNSVPVGGLVFERRKH